MSVEEKNLNTNIDKDGNIAISPDVVATISAIAAKSIDGVYFGSVNNILCHFRNY